MNLTETFKIGKWWNYKIGGALFTFILTKAIFRDSGVNTEEIILFITFLLLILLGFGINDFTDYEADKSAGKNNFFN